MILCENILELNKILKKMIFVLFLKSFKKRHRRKKKRHQQVEKEWKKREMMTIKTKEKWKLDLKI
jgi:hypothetical protein